jgi:hypothetical protein
MKKLVYYTLGYSNKYLDITKLSIQSLLYNNKDFDIIILIDEQFYNEALFLQQLDPKIKLICTPNSSSAQEASMRKIEIFNYNIQSYDVVLYIDSDILIDCSLEDICNKITITDKLCVGSEKCLLDGHKMIYWSLNNYTQSHFEYFRQNNIYAFNAGLFGFKPTNQMKNHFTAIKSIIKSHTGEYFYEQSFMNYYFNLINGTDRTVFTFDNYILFPEKKKEYKNTILHFCGIGDDTGNNKLNQMNNYINSFMPYLI